MKKTSQTHLLVCKDITITLVLIAEPMWSETCGPDQRRVSLLCLVVLVAG